MWLIWIIPLWLSLWTDLVHLPEVTSDEAWEETKIFGTLFGFYIATEKHVEILEIQNKYDILKKKYKKLKENT